MNKPSVDRQGDRVKDGVREWDKEKLEREAERTKGREVREVKRLAVFCGMAKTV